MQQSNPLEGIIAKCYYSKGNGVGFNGPSPCPTTIPSIDYK